MSIWRVRVAGIDNKLSTMAAQDVETMINAEREQGYELFYPPQPFVPMKVTGVPDRTHVLLTFKRASF